MSEDFAQVDLQRRLCTIADTMVEGRAAQLSDAAIRQLRSEVETQLGRILDDRLIGYEAACMVGLLAELAYARTDRSAAREERAKMYINCFRVFMRSDLDAYRKRMAEGAL